MKSTKTNILLAIIAFNLTLLTFIQLEIWPTKANANELGLDPSINYGLVPLNDDGSIDVNIRGLDGQNAFFRDEDGFPLIGVHDPYN